MRSGAFRLMMQDFDRLVKAFKIWYEVSLENKEHALRGWNWGKAEPGGPESQELTFLVQNRPAFEIPYSEISNTNLAGKNEVAIEFFLDNKDEQQTNGTNGENGHKSKPTKNKGRKAAAGRDEIVEMRFYIPGVVSKKEKKENGAASGEEEEGEEDAEELENAAETFYETILDRANVGEVAGETIATFQEVLHLTPRGRFTIDMFESSLRMRGKTHSYKIDYSRIKKVFLLPKTDEMHDLLVLGIDPPIIQGQTQYPFTVMQLKKDEDIQIELNLTEETINEKYKDKLQPAYEASISEVMKRVLSGLTNLKTVKPSKDFSSHNNLSGVKCSIKANEGILYCSEKAFLFVPKPATYARFEHVSHITMSRVGGALTASRTFDITVTMKAGQGEHTFSNINREEQVPLESFFRAKSLKYVNEMEEDPSALMAAVQDDLISSEDEVAGPARGSADEDEESVDDDFQADSDSDVAEEFDSEHESAGSGSDAEMGDGDAAGAMDDASEEERPKKKSKKS